jgi:hypothetical protein
VPAGVLLHGELREPGGVLGGDVQPQLRADCGVFVRQLPFRVLCHRLRRFGLLGLLGRLPLLRRQQDGERR